MLHNCLGGARGRVHEVVGTAEHMKRVNDKILKMLTKHTKKNATFLYEKLKEDVYLSADEAIEWGVIDNIVGREPKKPATRKKATTKKATAKKKTTRKR